MKFRITILSVFLLLNASLKISAQVTPQWTNTQSGTGDNSDRYNAVVKDVAGNIYAAGYSFNTAQDKDYLVVKMNSVGDTVWTRQYNNTNGNGSDKAMFIALDASNNIYVCGVTDGGSVFQNDILTQKYSNAGTLLWSATYNYLPFNQDDSPLGLFINTAGDVFVTGQSDRDSSAIVNDDIITIKYNTSGVQLWAARYNGTGNATDRGTAITGDNLGGCVITGRTFSLLFDDVITISYSSTGTVTWQTIYDRGFGNDRGEDITRDASGNIYVTGRSENANDYDLMTIKYNSAGVAQWTKMYDNVDNDFGNTIAVDATGNVYVAGQTDIQNSGGNTDYDYVTIKYNSVGTQLWASLYGNPVLNAEDPNKILVDDNGNVFVTGKSDMDALASITTNNFLTVKYNSAGAQLWAVYLNGTSTVSDDIAEGMFLDAAGNPVIVGGTENLVTQRDAAVISYATATGAFLWSKKFNGKGDFTDKVNAMMTDNHKNIFITGYVITAEQKRNLFCSKINSAGVTVWNKTYDFSFDDDEGRAIGIDTAGGIYVCGSSIGSGTSDDYVVVKFDTLGNITWTYRYNFVNEADVAVSISVLPNGTSFITGYSDQNISNLVSNYDITTIKLSVLGVEQAVIRYNGTGNGADRGVKVFALNASNIWVTGRMFNGTNEDAVVIKYNGALTQLWLPAFAGAANLNDQPRDLFIDASGNSFVAGNTGTVANDDDYFAKKYNNSGVLQWTYNYNGTGNFVDRAYGITANANGVYLTGRSALNSITDTGDIVTIKLNLTTGAQLWLNRFNGTGLSFDRGNDVMVDNPGNIYVVGETFSTTSGSDFITLMYNDAGTVSWNYKYNGTGNGEDVGRTGAVDVAGNICVTGYSTGATNTGLNLTTLKFCSPLSLPVFTTTTAVVCRNQTGVVYSINPVAGATSYTWTVTSGASITAGQGTTSVTLSFSAIANSASITVVANGVCGASPVASFDYTVTVAVPTVPGTITGPAVSCANTTANYSIAAVATATSYLWTAPANTTILSGQGTNAITLSFGAAWVSGNLSVKSVNCFGSSANKTKALKSKPATPGVITGPTTGVCAGTSAVIYSIAPVANATTYTWVAPLNSTIISGQGTTSVTINFGATFTNGNLTVTASNGCGTSAVRTAAIGSVPAVPTTITGLTNNLCNAGNKNYSCTAMAGATSYTWSVPANTSIVSGQGTNAVIINFAAAFVSGTIKVHATNGCGSSIDKSLNAYARPATPAAITGTATVCANQAAVIYSIAAVSGATSYTWSAPVGASIISGQGTISVSINFGSTAGNVSVYATNACANSATKSLAVSITCREEEMASESLEIFPNPTSDYITLRFSSLINAESEIQILDLLSQKMDEKKINAEFGMNEMSFDVSRFAKGIYFLRIQQADKIIVKRFEVQ